MSSPRSRSYSRVLGLASVLWSLAFALVGSRVVLLSRRIRSLDSRLIICESDCRAISCKCLESQHNFQSARENEAVRPNAPFEVPPQFSVLGRGRLSSWVYVDIRFEDGEVLRYYTRISDGPEGASNTVSRIRSDSFLHRAPSIPSEP